MPTYHHNNSLNQNQAEPAWNKEKIHAKMQRERRLLEEGEMDDRPPGAKWPFKLIGSLLVVIAIGLAVFGVTQFIKLRADGEWHHIYTTVTATDITKDVDSKKKVSYDVIGIYTYTVKAHTFQFRAFEASYIDLSTAQANAPSFIGRRTDVYYNPISPGQVASFPVMTVSVVISLAVAFVLLLLSSFFWARGLEHTPKVPPRLKPAAPDAPDAASTVNP